MLVLLFITYISDKYAGVRYAPITVPSGASFKDMVALKGKSTIGDDINKKIIGRIAEANKLTGIIDVADFNNCSENKNRKPESQTTRKPEACCKNKVWRGRVRLPSNRMVNSSAGASPSRSHFHHCV